MEAFPGPIGYEPVKEGGSGADDFGHHVVLRFGARQIHEPDPLYGIFSLQDFGDAPALGISLHENIENYIKRLEKLEEITGSYPGVETSYAIQAGREVRVMVKPEQVSEDDMVILARELAKRIESELEYPGQIKVHVLRETKVIEYAK